VGVRGLSRKEKEKTFFIEGYGLLVEKKEDLSRKRYFAEKGETLTGKGRHPSAP